MGPAKPGLLHMTLGLLPLRDGPKRRNKRPPMFVNSDGMEADFNVVAKAGVVKAEHGKHEIPGKGSEPEPGRNSVRADGGVASDL